MPIFVTGLLAVIAFGCLGAIEFIPEGSPSYLKGAYLGCSLLAFLGALFGYFQFIYPRAKKEITKGRNEAPGDSWTDLLFKSILFMLIALAVAMALSQG